MSKGEVRPRGRGGRGQRRVILIICEGERTEPIYFAHFREELRGKANIKILDSNVKDAPGLARFAMVMKERFGLETKDGDRIWLVFDADENSQAQVDAAAKVAGRIDANISLSNPCFELWYLLHFEDRREGLDRVQAIARLRRYLPDYDKSVDCCEVLDAGQTAAFERARGLEERMGNPLSIAGNPSTGVWRVVGELKRIAG